MQQQQQQHTAEIAKMQQDAMMASKMFEEKLLHVKAIEDRITKLEVERTKQEGLKDLNKDGVPDMIAEAKQQIERDKINLDAKKHEDKMALEEKKLKAKNK